MKKIFTFMFLTLFAISLASAAYNVDASANMVGDVDPMLLADGSGVGGVNSNGSGTGTMTGEPMARIQGDGQLMLKNGELLQFSGDGEKIKLQVGEHSAECNGCELSQGEDGKLQAKMSNGVNAEIKIMPDQANEKALERLQLKSCDDCIIELKEVGKGNETKMAYEIKTEKEARMFGIFKTRMNVEAQIDAETGEVIKSRKPWWAFLASEPAEE